MKRAARTPGPRAALAGAALITACLSASAADAQYRLRADAYYTANDPATGLFVLSSEVKHRSLIEADAVVWLGTGDRNGDVMVASIRAREPHGYGEARVGRMLITAGGLKAVHLDGADIVGRAPWGTTIEVFGGAPTTPEFQYREFDWAVGGRVSQRISKYGTVGVGYLHLRQAGAVAFEELGIDALATPLPWLDAAFSSAVDLQSFALADARLSLAARFKSVRLELFGVRRSPAHLLPATSLFSALGDVPSQRAGASLLWRAAPRLDVLAEGNVESLAGATPMDETSSVAPIPAQLGARGMFRATLRLDDRGDGALQIEVRRQSVPSWPGVDNASWTGVRGTARVPINRWFIAAAELEIVAPDDPRGRGVVWPWGLVGLRFHPAERWEMAGALECGASPTAVSQVSGIFRIGYAWGTK